ncbi:MAG: hypothetical protein Q7S03_02190 [bacterium]|nr:hypothetical protein [bacterium]
MKRFSKSAIFRHVIPLSLFSMPFLIPVYPPDDALSTLLAVVSLLFAILVGFFIAAATSNFLRLQSLIANEDGALIAIYNLSKIIDSNSSDKIADVIDNYATKSLDFELEEYVDRSQKDFEELLEAIDGLKIKNKEGENLFQILHQKKVDLWSNRLEAEMVSRKVIPFWHWLTIILLALLLSVSLFSLRNGSLFVSLSVSALLLSIYLALVLLHEVDSNVFLEKQLSYENTQKIFKILGRLAYYPEAAIKEKRVEEPKETYRIGIYSSSGEREIKIIEK